MCVISIGIFDVFVILLVETVSLSQIGVISCHHLLNIDLLVQTPIQRDHVALQGHLF